MSAELVVLFKCRNRLWDKAVVGGCFFTNKNMRDTNVKTTKKI